MVAMETKVCHMIQLWTSFQKNLTVDCSYKRNMVFKRGKQCAPLAAGAQKKPGLDTVKQLTRDPTKKNEKRVNEGLKRLAKNGCISKEKLEKLRLPEGSSCAPLLYGRVKLHKEGHPLRPIVSSVGSCAHKVGKEVARVLAPYSRGVASYIKHTIFGG